MRYVSQQSGSGAALEIDERQRADLSNWLTIEVTDAIAAMNAQYATWANCLRQYNAVPKNPVRNVPIENAPNVEIPLGAIGTDSIYAQVIDLIYNISPLVTCTATNAKYVEHRKAFQTWVEYVANNELDLRAQTEHSIFDDVSLGTGVHYTPWVEEVRKTRSVERLARHPKTFAVPPEDVIVPGGSSAAVDDLTWIGLRFWYDKAELKLMAKQLDWDISDVQPCGSTSMLRNERERLSRTHMSSQRMASLFEIIVIYAYYDIDDDGIAEDIEIVWDRTSASVLWCNYCKYDHRPISKMCYQIRAHNFHGQGVMEMIAPIGDAVSDVSNYWMTNMLVANARVWKARIGTVPDNMMMWPNKIIELSDPADLVPEVMADVYNSGPQAVAMLMGLAERRTGTNDMTLPRPSQVLGSRTPATTSTMMFQQISRRFTPAFDAVRMCVADVVKQAMYRYQERVMARDAYTMKHIIEVLGQDDALLVFEVLRDEHFDEGIKMEMTASSATVNRETERQNAMFLISLLSQYYEKTVQLTTMAANVQLPQPVRDIAMKIAKAAGEIVERTIRTFDQIRDPEEFIINVEAEIDQLGQDAQQQQAMQALMALMPQYGTGQMVLPQ